MRVWCLSNSLSSNKEGATMPLSFYEEKHGNEAKQSSLV
jgi:hypothetical protein